MRWELIDACTLRTDDLIERGVDWHAFENIVREVLTDDEFLEYSEGVTKEGDDVLHWESQR